MFIFGEYLDCNMVREAKAKVARKVDIEVERNQNDLMVFEDTDVVIDFLDISSITDLEVLEGREDTTFMVNPECNLAVHVDVADGVVVGQKVSVEDAREEGEVVEGVEARTRVKEEIPMPKGD